MSEKHEKRVPPTTAVPFVIFFIIWMVWLVGMGWQNVQLAAMQMSRDTIPSLPYAGLLMVGIGLVYAVYAVWMIVANTRSEKSHE